MVALHKFLITSRVAYNLVVGLDNWNIEELFLQNCIGILSKEDGRSKLSYQDLDA